MARKNITSLEGRFWLTSGGRNFAGQGRVDLLKRIKDTGSISAAAKQIGMSYKAAWDSVDVMNKLSDKPLVERASGGKNGGGTLLTEEGMEFISLYEKYTETFDKLLLFMEKNPGVTTMVDKLSFKSSADNSFYGTVKKIEKGAVSAIVEVKVSDVVTVISSITNESVGRMGLCEGAEVCALINANQITVMPKDDNVVVSARNKFNGKVKLITKGAVNSEINMELTEGTVLKVLVTNESCEGMGLSYDMELTAFCKASSVVLIA